MLYNYYGHTVDIYRHVYDFVIHAVGHTSYSRYSYTSCYYKIYIVCLIYCTLSCILPINAHCFLYHASCVYWCA